MGLCSTEQCELSAGKRAIDNSMSVNNEIIEIIRDDVKYVKEKLDNLDAHYVRKDSFKTLYTLVITMLTTILGYIGFEVGK